VTTLGSRPLFVPLTMRELIEKRRPLRKSPLVLAVSVCATQPGVSIEQASTSLNTMYSRILTGVEAPLQEGMSDKTMVSFKSQEDSRGTRSARPKSVHTEAKTPLLMLFGTPASCC
jgi:hypothetical protein